MTHLGTFGTMTRDAAGWEQAWTRKEELEFLRRITKNTPCGGEAVLGMDGRQESTGFVVSELKTMHLTYLNCAHDRKVLDDWKQISWSTEGVWKEHSLYDYVWKSSRIPPDRAKCGNESVSVWKMGDGTGDRKYGICCALSGDGIISCIGGRRWHVGISG